MNLMGNGRRPRTRSRYVATNLQNSPDQYHQAKGQQVTFHNNLALFSSNLTFGCLFTTINLRFLAGPIRSSSTCWRLRFQNRRVSSTPTGVSTDSPRISASFIALMTAFKAFLDFRTEKPLARTASISCLVD